MPNQNYLMENGLSTKRDDQIVGSYLMAQKETNQQFLFLSNDRVPCMKARGAGLAVFNYYHYE